MKILRMYFILIIALMLTGCTVQDSGCEIIITAPCETPTPEPTIEPTIEPTLKPTPKPYKVIKAEITAYCACPICNGKYSMGEETETASGRILKNTEEYANKYCAATAAVGKLGDVVIIDGLRYRIVDRMGRKDGYAIDIFVPNHADCADKYGRRRNVEVKVVDKSEVDYE